MSCSWNENNLSDLGRVFLRNVRDNMRDKVKSTVKFGTTGKGEIPNYQVTYPNGLIRTIRGSSHKNMNEDQFNNKTTSEDFTFAQLNNAYNSLSK